MTILLLPWNAKCWVVWDCSSPHSWAHIQGSLENEWLGSAAVHRARCVAFFSGACHLIAEGGRPHPDFKSWYLPQSCMWLDSVKRIPRNPGVFTDRAHQTRSSTSVTCFKDPWNQTSGIFNKEFFYGHTFGFIFFVGHSPVNMWDLIFSVMSDETESRGSFHAQSLIWKACSPYFIETCCPKDIAWIPAEQTRFFIAVVCFPWAKFLLTFLPCYG